MHVHETNVPLELIKGMNDRDISMRLLVVLGA